MARVLEFGLLAISLAYPFLIYFGLRVLPPADIAIGLAGLLAARIGFASRQNRREILPYVLAGVALLIVIVRSPIIGLKTYPVLLSLTFGAVFAYSLLRPPTVVERIARLQHPELPLEANSYLRKVTMAWLGFFLINASISAATAFSGSMRIWTLYNGLVSYLAMGALFAGEFLIRRRVYQRLGRSFT
jgi:uncharacterized membrane protein